LTITGEDMQTVADVIAKKRKVKLKSFVVRQKVAIDPGTCQTGATFFTALFPGTTIEGALLKYSEYSLSTNTPSPTQ
jgi:hypothetical protein